MTSCWDINFLYACIILIFLILSYYRRDISFLDVVPGVHMSKIIIRETELWWRPILNKKFT